MRKLSETVQFFAIYLCDQLKNIFSAFFSDLSHFPALSCFYFFRGVVVGLEKFKPRHWIIWSFIATRMYKFMQSSLRLQIELDMRCVHDFISRPHVKRGQLIRAQYKWNDQRIPLAIEIVRASTDKDLTQCFGVVSIAPLSLTRAHDCILCRTHFCSGKYASNRECRLRSIRTVMGFRMFVLKILRFHQQQ